MHIFSKSLSPSYVTPPFGEVHPTVYAFLQARFPRIDKGIWHERIDSGKVHFDDGELVTFTTIYQARRRICYYREVQNEQLIRFKEKILFENETFLIVDKPHFLPIHPAGKFVNQTLLTRLSSEFGYTDLIAAHRLDRLTAGLIVCVKKKEFRAHYQKLFMNGLIDKSYLAVGKLPTSDQKSWHIKNRMEPYNEHFRMQIVPNGEHNSETVIKLIESKNDSGLFQLTPITGKKHQLRVHMSSIGSGIVNDPLYPSYAASELPDDYQNPLQLLAHKLSFTDPITGEKMSFTSEQTLAFN